MSPQTEWLIAFCTGAFVILIFSWERLNRRVGAGNDAARGDRRERILALVQPARLRNSRVFARGYVFYTTLLLLLYTLASVVSSIAGLFVPPAAADTTTGAAQALVGDPAWPLAVALMMTGLAPSVGILSRFEERIRQLAHSLVGIPESFNRFTDALMDVRLDPAQRGYDLLDETRAKRLEKALAAAHASTGRSAEFIAFATDATKLYAFEAWQAGTVRWPAGGVRRQFSAIETVIAPEIAGVVADIDTLAESSTGTPDAAALTTRWQNLYLRAAGAAEDACALFALYAERARNLPVRGNPISALLRTLIEEAQRNRRGARPRADVVLMALVIVSLTAALIGYVGGKLGIMGDGSNSSAMIAAYQYLMGVVVFYGPTSVLAWSARSGAVRGTYVNPYARRGLFPMSQFVRLFILGFIVSVLFMSLLNLLQLSVGHITRLAAENGELRPSAACVLVQYFGFELMPNPDPAACEPSGLFQLSLAYAPLGAWNTVCLALVGDLVQARADRGLRLLSLLGIHAGVLSLLTLLAADVTGRLVPLEGAVSSVVPDLLNPAQELVAFEMIAAAVLAITFSMITRSALRQLRDGEAPLRGVDDGMAQPA